MEALKLLQEVESAANDMAKTCYMLMSNAAGVEAEDEALAVAIIAEMLKNVPKPDSRLEKVSPIEIELDFAITKKGDFTLFALIKTEESFVERQYSTIPACEKGLLEILDYLSKKYKWVTFIVDADLVNWPGVKLLIEKYKLNVHLKKPLRIHEIEKKIKEMLAQINKNEK